MALLVVLRVQIEHIAARLREAGTREVAGPTAVLRHRPDTGPRPVSHPHTTTVVAGSGRSEQAAGPNADPIAQGAVASSLGAQTTSPSQVGARPF